jgi:hypothetical protein
MTKHKVRGITTPGQDEGRVEYARCSLRSYSYFRQLLVHKFFSQKSACPIRFLSRASPINTSGDSSTIISINWIFYKWRKATIICLNMTYLKSDFRYTTDNTNTHLNNNPLQQKIVLTVFKCSVCTVKTTTPNDYKDQLVNAQKDMKPTDTLCGKTLK